MKKGGYRESTIVSRVKILRALARKADLSSPEAVKDVIARLNVSEGRKENLVCAYGGFCRQYGIPFESPRYRRIQHLPFIPLESEVDQLIAGMGPKASAYLQLFKETGMRAGEAWLVRWIDLDSQRLTVSIAPERRSLPRQFKITSRLLSMLSRMPRNVEYVFGGGELDHFARWFYMKRQKIAEKLGNSIQVEPITLCAGDITQDVISLRCALWRNTKRTSI